MVLWAKEGLLEKNDVRMRWDRTAESRQVMGDRIRSGVGGTAMCKDER